MPPIDGNGSSSSLLPTPSTSDAKGPSPSHAGTTAEAIRDLLPTPCANDSGNTPEEHLAKKPGRSVVTSLMVLVNHDLLRSGGRVEQPDEPAGMWGRYAPAIGRWENLTRPAPEPRNDKGRLAPSFSEWMMGLSEGWVTDVDISYSAQLKAIGNGVCPQQAAAALRMLLQDETT